MLGWLHQGDDSGCPRLPDSRTAFRLRQGECCCHEAEAIARCTGPEANAASVARVERTRHSCPFASKPGTPAPCETLCGARVGVGRRCWRRGSLRDLYPSRRAAGRVPPSGRGHRSERLTCRSGRAGAGASRDAAHGTHIRTADHPASTGFDQRWKETANRNKTPVSWHSWSLGSGFVREGQGQSWQSSADVLFTRRGGSQDTEAVSPIGARDNRGGSLRRLYPLPLCQAAEKRGGPVVRRRTCHSLTWLNGRSE